MSGADHQSTVVQHDLTDTIVSLFADMPEVNVGKHLSNINFTIGKKVFAFLKQDSLVLKLPEACAQKLIAERRAVPLVMGKRVMKEWVVI